MLSNTRPWAAFLLTSRMQSSARRCYSNSASKRQEIANPKSSKETENVSKSNELPIETPSQDARIQEYVEEGESVRVMQAPNRAGIWSRSQNPRAKAMTGPRFEQTIMKLQPSPQAAIDLIHKQPVRWSHQRVVECNGGGGPLGHPRIFINLDKPEICECTYCGLPFAHEHHRKHLESLPSTPYPLTPQGEAAEVPFSQRITDEALGQR